MNLYELQTKIHEQNKSVGWWDEPRPFETFVCLFHSELSEAMEGDRKGLMDDHLPHYPMFQVELADFVIRCMDFLGSVCKSDPYGAPISLAMSNTELIAHLHSLVSSAYEYNDIEFFADRNDSLIDGVLLCLGFSRKNNFDLQKIILEKVEYNRTRADHKRENREKEGGKKY